MERPDLQALCRLRPDDEQPRSNVARSSRRLCTSCVQEGGSEGPENGPKQRRINNRLLSYRPKPKNNFKILAGERGPARSSASSTGRVRRGVGRSTGKCPKRTRPSAQRAVSHRE